MARAGSRYILQETCWCLRECSRSSACGYPSCCAFISVRSPACGLWKATEDKTDQAATGLLLVSLESAVKCSANQSNMLTEEQCSSSVRWASAPYPVAQALGDGVGQRLQAVPEGADCLALRLRRQPRVPRRRRIPLLFLHHLDHPRDDGPARLFQVIDLRTRCTWSAGTRSAITCSSL